MADPDWRGGAYAEGKSRPEKGLAVARMAAHITYLSEPALQRKFGRELQRDGLSWGFDADFQVESYLRHQGASFVDRFDANSYLYITRAMDYFDLAAKPWRGAGQAFTGRARALLRAVLHQRLAVSDRREPPHRPRAERRRLPRRPSSRSRATRATTPSCWTSR
jgi:homoserine O-acetyltransferase